MADLINTSSVAALASVSTAISSITGILLATPATTQGYLPNNAPAQSGLLSLLNGPPGILFDYEGEQTTTFSSDITDHFLEDNTAVSDQIALKPVIITTHGFIGELNNVAPVSLALLQTAANTLVSVTGYLPSLSVSAQLAYDSALASYQVATSAINSAVSAISSISGKGGETVIGSIGGTITKQSNQNRQQTYFQLFYGYWQTRTLFTVQTPWAVFQNMAIQSVRAIQDAETRTMSDFEVTFKQMNIASTALLGNSLQGSGRNLTQSAANTALGTGSLNPTSFTVSGAISGLLGGR